jgi:hypothetical protein
VEDIMASGPCGNCRKNASYVRECKHCGVKICSACTSKAVQGGGKCPSCGKVGLKPA